MSRKNFHLAAVVAALSAVSVSAFSAPASLPAARTIQVHETGVDFDKNGKVASTYSVVLRISRPDKVKAMITVPAGKKQSAATYQYVDSGKTQTHYMSSGNVYGISPSVGNKSTDQIRSWGDVDLVLDSPHIPGPGAGARRAVSTEMISGIPMTVTTDRYPAQKGTDGAVTAYTSRYWVEKQSGKPFQRMMFITAKGKTRLSQKVTFSDWTLNQPLARPLLAFVPPAGAKLYIPPKLLAVGTNAPDFAAVTPDGKTVHLSDYRGKTVVLDFWATWCSPCQMSMPHLENVYQQVKDKDAVVLALCVWDTKPAYAHWLADKSGTYNFPTAFDPSSHGTKSVVTNAYRVDGIPVQYVIDKDGKVAAAYSGYQDGDTRLEKALIAQGVALPPPATTVSDTP